MSGWLRLWILVSAIYTCMAGWVAVETWPTEQEVKYDWILEGTTLVAQAITVTRGEETKRYEVEEKLRETRDDDQLLEYFRKVASSPTEAQRSISASMATINERFDHRVPEPVQRHIVHMLMVLALPVIALFLLGRGIGWVVQGFRGNKRTPHSG
jgi:hypothetical protein